MILALSDKNFRANIKLIPSAQIVAYCLYNLFVFLIQLLLSLSVLKVIDQNISVFEAISSVAKKSFSLVASLLVVAAIVLSAIVDLVAMGVIGQISHNLFAQILLWGAAIIFLVIFIKFSLRACFYTISLVVEEKYFFNLWRAAFFTVTVVF